MLSNTEKKRLARHLLEMKAIELSPESPYEWASGWHSPIYCDNRKTLSYPAVRSLIKTYFVKLIRDHYPEAEVIAGVATGAIAQGALVAYHLDLPFVYVRSQPKSHGLQNQMEGVLEPGKKVVVIEDLVSTGKSSLNAVEALRENGAEVLGMLAIFSYGFELAERNIRESNCELFTLTNYQVLLEEALETGYITREQEATLAQWRNDPANWKADD